MSFEPNPSQWAPADPVQRMGQPPVSNEAVTLVVLAWIGTLLFGFLPPLVVYLVRKDDLFVRAHATEALNWAICYTLGMLICGVLMYLLVGFLLMPLLAIYHFVVCLIAAVKGSNRELWRLPLNIRLIRG